MVGLARHFPMQTETSQTPALMYNYTRNVSDGTLVSHPAHGTRTTTPINWDPVVSPRVPRVSQLAQYPR